MLSHRHLLLRKIGKEQVMKKTPTHIIQIQPARFTIKEETEMPKTKSKNLTANENCNISVSTDIKTVVPDIMVKYLCELALCANLQNNESRLFVLKAGELSGRSIQNIYHFCGNGCLLDRRRVYGTVPVNCNLQITNSQDTYQIQLCMRQ